MESSRMIPRRATIHCLGLLGVGCLWATVALACPTCKDTLAGDPTAEGLARGFYYSILFMLSMPPLILGSLCAYFYFLVRHAQQEPSAAQN
jgi:hypothetical protein